MSLKQTIDNDIKKAMLAKNKEELELLRRQANEIDSWKSPYKAIVSVKTVLEEDMLQELTNEINAVVEDRKNGIFDDPEQGPGAYKPIIPLTVV